MQLFRDLSTELIQNALGESEGNASAVSLPVRSKRLEPQIYESSTVQSAECRSDDIRSFENADDDEGVRNSWHILVGCKHCFPTESTRQPQCYALALTVEHSDDTVRVSQPLSLQVTERLRTRARVGER
jgi:hypothetical protein